MVEHKVIELVENGTNLTHRRHLSENEDIFPLKAIRTDWGHSQVNGDLIKWEWFLIKKFKGFNNCRACFAPISLKIVDRVVNYVRLLFLLGFEELNNFVVSVNVRCS